MVPKTPESLRFVSDAELSLFEELVRSHYHGTGVIVDAGSFLGDSTIALAMGLSKAKPKPTTKSIIAIDRFVIRNRYIAEAFLQAHYDLRRGDSFLPIFLERTREFLSAIEVRAGEVTSVGRISEPIEVCVIDIAKNQHVSAYVAQQWFPQLMPSHSLVVHQDFYSPFLPWNAIVMAYLLDYFDVLVARVGETAVFRLRRPIPVSKINEAVSIKPESIDGLALLMELDAVLGASESTFVDLLRCRLLLRMGRIEEATLVLEKQRPVCMDSSAFSKLKKWHSMLSSALAGLA